MNDLRDAILAIARPTPPAPITSAFISGPTWDKTPNQFRNQILMGRLLISNVGPRS